MNGKFYNSLFLYFSVGNKSSIYCSPVTMARFATVSSFFLSQHSSLCVPSRLEDPSGRHPSHPRTVSLSHMELSLISSLSSDLRSQVGRYITNIFLAYISVTQSLKSNLNIKIFRLDIFKRILC